MDLLTPETIGRLRPARRLGPAASERLRWSSSGAWLAVNLLDHVRILNGETLAERARVPCPAQPRRLWLSADGGLLIAHLFDHTLLIAADGQPPRCIPARCAEHGQGFAVDARLQRIALRPDQTTLAIVSAQAPSEPLWQTTVEPGETEVLRFSPGGGHLAYGFFWRAFTGKTDSRVRWWRTPDDPEAFVQVANEHDRMYIENADLQLSDTHLLAYDTTAYFNFFGDGVGASRAWALDTGQLEERTFGSNEYDRMAFSPDGERVYSLNGRTLECLRRRGSLMLADHQLSERPTGLLTGAAGVLVTTTSGFLLAAPETLHIQGKHDLRRDDAPLLGASGRPDLGAVAVLYEDRVSLFDRQGTHRCSAPLPPLPQQLHALQPNGVAVFETAGPRQAWDLLAHRKLASHPRLAWADAARQLFWEADGALCCARLDGDILWRTALTGATHVAVSPDGRWVALAAPQEARLCDAETGAVRHTLPAPSDLAAREVQSLDFGDTAPWLLWTHESGITLWSAETGHRLLAHVQSTEAGIDDWIIDFLQAHGQAYLYGDEAGRLEGGHLILANDEDERLVHFDDQMNLIEGPHPYPHVGWEGVGQANVDQPRSSVNPGGTLFALGYDDQGSVDLAIFAEDMTRECWRWSLPSNTLDLRYSRRAIPQVRFTRDGHHLLTTTEQGTVFVWSCAEPGAWAAPGYADDSPED